MSAEDVASTRLLDLLAEFYEPKQARLWLLRPHSGLDGDTPASRVRAGRGMDVLALIDQMRSGAYG